MNIFIWTEKYKIIVCTFFFTSGNFINSTYNFHKRLYDVNANITRLTGLNLQIKKTTIVLRQCLYLFILIYKKLQKSHFICAYTYNNKKK